MSNPYLALLKSEKGVLSPVPKVTKATYDTFGTTPSEHIGTSSHAMQHPQNREKGSHAQVPKPTKAPFGTFDTTASSHATSPKASSTTSRGTETPSRTAVPKVTKDPYGTFGTKACDPFSHKDAMPSAAGSTLETDSQADAKGLFEGRCDILVSHQAICRLEADAMVRQYARNRDVAESKLLRLEAFYGLAKCPRCIHSRKPGDTLHCANPERSDLEPSYGLLRFIPTNGGATCPFWLKKHD